MEIMDYTIEKIDMSSYGSHIPMLEMLFKTFEIKKVVEFGTGMFSTVFFLKKKVDLFSIEMQFPEWIEQVNSKLVELGIPKWNSTVEIGALQFLKNAKVVEKIQQCDLAFVDGHEESRADVVNYMFQKAKIIVAHDYNKTNYYNWNRVKLPENYTQVIFGVGKRSTAVWILNELINVE
jgi:predicted O-methyltransferase YrrM